MLVPRVLYGVPFHNVTLEEAVDWATERIRTAKTSNIVLVDLAMVAEAWRDPELRRMLVDADLVLAQGGSMIRMAPRFGPEFKPMPGGDFVAMLIERAAKEGFSVYGLGHSERAIKKAFSALEGKYPNLKVTGAFVAPTDPLLEMNHPEIVQKLEEAKPDILMVAFDSPKQDKFISMHVQEWKIPISIGVGPAFHYFGGLRTNIPAVLRRSRNEWLWRLFTTPLLFANRNYKKLRFLFRATRLFANVRTMPDQPMAFQTLDEEAMTKLQSLNSVIAHFNPLKTEKDARKFVIRICSFKEANVILDMHDISWLDSLEVGALLEVNKRCRQSNHRLVLYAPRAKVRQLLEVSGLLDYFVIASRLDILVATLKSLEHAGGGTLYKEGLLLLDLPTELTAATVSAYEKQADFIRRELKEKGTLKTVRVNAAKLEFIDSSGLGFLIALKKHTMDEGVEMVIANLDEKPRHIFEIARVDSILLGE